MDDIGWEPDPDRELFELTRLAEGMGVPVAAIAAEYDRITERGQP